MHVSFSCFEILGLISRNTKLIFGAKFREISRNKIKISRNTKLIFGAKFREISYPPSEGGPDIKLAFRGTAISNLHELAASQRHICDRAEVEHYQLL
jgi:hypothetical protein